MNDNSIQINSYLQNEMTAEEKTAFESRLAADTALQQELDIQRRIIAAAEQAGLKKEFARAVRQRRMIRRTLMAATVIVICLLTVIVYTHHYNFFAGENSAVNKETVPGTAANALTKPFINPPLAAINVPVSEYNIDAATGGTIFHPSGSVIYFPPNAMTDENGVLIKGVVKITYREFADPLDFFVSGIPMQYDSAGKQYNFESSGMCEINAWQNSKAVFVNPKARPQLHLSSKNKSPLHSVYYLDTVARSWRYTGKDTITAVKKIQAAGATPSPAAIAETVNNTAGLPVKPVKASDDRPKFSIAIDPGSFEELFAYDNLKFEVLDESTYKRSDAEEHWDNVKLERGATEGIYDITFTNKTRKVTYKVRPVLEGEDYAAALKVFNEKKRAYEMTLQKRLDTEQRVADSINRLNRQLLDKMNLLIAERNKKLKEEVSRRLNEEVLRSFSIDNFGIWNCDQPRYPDKEVPLFVNYADSANNTITLNSVSVVYKGFNGITQFPAPAQIRVIPGSENMLWSISGEDFYYFSYGDFKKSGITANSRTFTFNLRKAAKKIRSYNEIRELAGNL